MNDPAREVMSWQDLGAGSRELAELVHRDGYRPDIVLAIARGGLLVGGAVGYALGVKNTFSMNVEFYTGVDERLEMPMLLPPVPDLVHGYISPAVHKTFPQRDGPSRRQEIVYPQRQDRMLLRTG